MFVVSCLFVCVLATLRKIFGTDLHEIFREGWQWTNHPDSYRDTGKMCLGGGMYCPSASRFNLLVTIAISANPASLIHLHLNNHNTL